MKVPENLLKDIELTLSHDQTVVTLRIVLNNRWVVLQGPLEKLKTTEIDTAGLITVELMFEDFKIIAHGDL